MNGYIAPLVNGWAQRYAISNEASIKILHKWRSQEAAIMVGTNTACVDNPKLNVREWSGKSPIRITIDKDLRIPDSAHLLDGKIQTLVFTSKAVKLNIKILKNIFTLIFLKIFYLKYPEYFTECRFNWFWLKEEECY